MKYGKKILAVVLLLLSGTGMLTAAAGSRTGDAQVRTERDLQLQSVTMEELEENGFRFRMETAAYFEDGRIKNVYLEGEYGGFAIHIMSMALFPWHFRQKC